MCVIYRTDMDRYVKLKSNAFHRSIDAHSSNIRSTILCIIFMSNIEKANYVRYLKLAIIML